MWLPVHTRVLVMHTGGVPPLQAGKTVALSMLLGVMAPTRGKVYVNNYLVGQVSAGTVNQYAGFGYVRSTARAVCCTVPSRFGRCTRRRASGDSRRHKTHFVARDLAPASGVQPSLLPACACN